ncbi:MAG TPA: iron-sulfur cluster assembly accessory protein [Pseudogracilibacillus sp.]|nr:iron-sulfur cluster assembly accessory protein [Pseudogracilibacillus sp.]
MIITITDNARTQIKEMMKDEPENAKLRFGVKGGGCSGLSYALGFEEEYNEELDVMEVINDIPVVIFKQDIPMLEDTEIDFKENLLGGGFSIKNPQAAYSCGCGSSFRPEEYKGEIEKCK